MDRPKKEVHLWSDQSEEAQKLKKELEEAGYTVKMLFNGSFKPTAFSQGLHTMGFENIRIDFGLYKSK